MGVVIGKYPPIHAGVYSATAYRTAFWVPLAGLIAGAILFWFFREDPIT